MFNLSFLNSGILTFALATFIPLIIYLFAKKRPRKIIFSSIRFIKESLQKKKTKINLKNLILLLIRMLIILFTILAISRPTIKNEFLKKGTKHPKTAIAVIIDNSYSMDYLVDTQTELEKAKDIAIQINEMLSNDDITALFSLDKDWNEVNSHLVYGKMDKKRIHSIKICSHHNSMQEIIEKAQEKLKQSHIPNQEIYVITDLQEEELPEKIDTPVFFIPTSYNEERFNLSCQNVLLVNDFVKKSFVKNISFEVVNHSAFEQKDVICRLFLDGRTVAEKVTELSSFQRKEENFQLELEKSGWHSGYVEVKNERLPFDNRFYFSFFYNHEPRIAVLSDDNYLPLAISSILEIYAHSSGRIEFPDVENINTEELLNYDNIIIYNKKNISGRMEFLLNNLQKEERGFLFIASKNINENSQKFLSEFFDIKFKKYISPDQNFTLDYANAYHPITKLLKISELNVTDFWQISAKSTVLLQADFSPLAVMNKNSILWLFECNSMQNPFLLDHSFPVFAYQSLQFLANDFVMSTNIRIGQKIQLTSNELTLSDGTNIDVQKNFYIPVQTGLFGLDSKGTTIAVNLDYKESEFSKFSQIKTRNIHLLDNNWQNNILQARYGYEIWKLLLVLVLILFLLEMIIVKSSEKNSR